MSISPRWFAFLTLLCATLAVLLLSPGLSGGFIFDDTANIIENGALHITSLDAQSLLQAAYSFQPGGGSRPLSMLSFALDFWRGGLIPSVFKTTNLFIHALTTIALVPFLRLLFTLAGWTRSRATLAALSLGLLWAIHPLQASTVLYVVQRMQTLATLFMVLALFAYLRARQAQIEGQPSRKNWGLMVLFWALAFASKEDSALLPAYTLALEITVLGFRGAQPNVAQALRRTYLVLALVGLAAYTMVVIPHFWSWEAYPSRDFSSYERLLTQARVLVMYLGQILLPLPGNLPFFYDDLAPSRGLLEPVTTLPALAAVVGLLLLAWRWHEQRPVFALGILIFFAGHFVTSNVIGLELAFEHRNHFPLIGAVLAAGDLIFGLLDRLCAPRSVATAILLALLIAAGSFTSARASVWGHALKLAHESVELAPSSVRAWLLLCTTYFELSGRNPEHPFFNQAIEYCGKGGELPYSAAPLANVVLFKALNGSVVDADWERFLARLRTVPMNAENKRLIWAVISNFSRNNSLDEERVLETVEIAIDRARFLPAEYLRIAYFVLDDTKHPEAAYTYFVRSMDAIIPRDPLIPWILSDLTERGREDWAQQLEERARSQGKLESNP